MTSPRGFLPDRTTATLGGAVGVALIAGLILGSTMEVGPSDRRLFLSTLPLLGVALCCLIVLSRAERDRRLVGAERRLARLSVEEQTMARQRAEEADAISRELVQRLGRELRGPLVGIRGFARELQERQDMLAAPQRNEFLAVIRRQSNRLLRVTEDLMLASRIAGGEASTEDFVPVDIPSLVADTVAEVEAGSTNPVVVSIREDLPRVRGDAAELRQALLALMENAIRYSPAGRAVEVTALMEGSRVEISVLDHGIGIPDHLRDVIFEPFAVGSARSPGAPGSVGIGLFIVRNVAARCEGEVRVHSGNQGTVFTLALPAIEGEADPSGPSALTAPSHPARIEVR
jgi:signal transduction histidine kinase